MLALEGGVLRWSWLWQYLVRSRFIRPVLIPRSDTREDKDPVAEDCVLIRSELSLIQPVSEAMYCGIPERLLQSMKCL